MSSKLQHKAISGTRVSFKRIILRSPICALMYKKSIFSERTKVESPRPRRISGRILSIDLGGWSSKLYGESQPKNGCSLTSHRRLAAMR